MKRLMRSTLPWQSSRLRSLASLCLLDPSRFSVSEAPPCTPRSSLLQDWSTFPQYAAGRVGVLLSVFHADSLLGKSDRLVDAVLDNSQTPGGHAQPATHQSRIGYAQPFARRSHEVLSWDLAVVQKD